MAGRGRAPRSYKSVESFDAPALSSGKLIADLTATRMKTVYDKTDGNCIRYARDRAAEIRSHAREEDLSTR